MRKWRGIDVLSLLLWVSVTTGKNAYLLCRENRQLAICTRFQVDRIGLSGFGNKVRLTTSTAQNDKYLLFDNLPHSRTSTNCFVGSRDDEIVAASSSDDKVYIRSVPDGRGERTINQPLLTFDGSRYTTCLRFSPQNCALVSCGSYSTLIKVWTPVRLTNQTDDDRWSGNSSDWCMIFYWQICLKVKITKRVIWSDFKFKITDVVADLVLYCWKHRKG